VLAPFKDQSFVEDVRFGRGHFYCERVILFPNPKIVNGHLDSVNDRYRDKSQGLGVEPLLDLKDDIIFGTSLIRQEFYFYLLTHNRTLIVYDWRRI